MLCHECEMAGTESRAVAVCRYCFVGLCKAHLIQSTRKSATPVQYACGHNPASVGQASHALQGVSR